MLLSNFTDGFFPHFQNLVIDRELEILTGNPGQTLQIGHGKSKHRRRKKTSNKLDIHCHCINLKKKCPLRACNCMNFEITAAKYIIY